MPSTGAFIHPAPHLAVTDFTVFGVEYGYLLTCKSKLRKPLAGLQLFLAEWTSAGPNGAIFFKTMTRGSLSPRSLCTQVGARELQLTRSLC